MSKRKQKKRRPRKASNSPPTTPAPLDPETGLPPVGRGLPGEADRILERARAKHRHRQR